MKNLFFLFALSVFQLGAQEAISPIVKECQKATDPKACSSEKWAEFEKSLQATLEASSGFSIADSLYVRFKVTGEGNAEVAESFALISKVTLLNVVEALKDKAIDLKPSLEDQFYEWAWETKFDDNFSNYESIEDVDRYPQMKECNDFNSKGQKGCFRYILFKAQEQIKKEGVNDNAVFNLYIKNGTVVGVKVVQLPLSKTLADRIVGAVNEKLQAMATPVSREGSDEFFVNMKFHIFGDSLARWNLQAERLTYLQKLNNKVPFIVEVLEIEKINFQRQKKAGADYVLSQLKTIGLDTVSEFRLGSFVYSVDSIRNYKEELTEDGNRVNNFGVVESVPIFNGCVQYKGDNEKLKICFQNEIMLFVSKTFVYPKEARYKGIQGKGYVSFVVEKDGRIDNIDFLKGSNILLDLECIRVISELPDMHSSAVHRGKPVRISFTMPINAKLQ